MKPVTTEEFWKQRIIDSKNYGDIHHSVYISPNSLWKQIEEIHKKILLPYVDKKVLDAGCGYGRASQWFTNYTGVDLSPDLLEKARGFYPNKNFIQGRLEKLPFKDKEFDMAFCISIKAMIIGNLGEAVWQPMEEELKRVAKEVIILEYEEAGNFTVLH